MPTVVVCTISYAVCEQSQCRFREITSSRDLGERVSLCNTIPGSGDEDVEEDGDVEEDEDVELSELVEPFWVGEVVDDLAGPVYISAESVDVSSRTVSVGLAIRAESVNVEHTGVGPFSTLVTNCVYNTVT